MAPEKDAAQSAKDEERMAQFRAAFAVWTTPKPKTAKKPEESTTPKGKPPTKHEEPVTLKIEALPKPERSVTPANETAPKTPMKDEDKNSGAAIKDESPALSPCISINTQEDEVLPLSAANLIRSTEEEEQRLLARVEKSYSLSGNEVREVIRTKAIKKWLTQADPEGCKEDTESDGFRSGNGKLDGGVKISLEEVVQEQQEQTDAASSNPYMMERTERIAATKERISILRSRNKIKPGIFLFLRHAMHIDAEYLAGIVNSYVRCSAHTLESKPISVHDIIQRIDDSRNQELPFIVAIKQSAERDFDSRVPWGRVLGFVRLTNFLHGQPSVACTAQMEIMVAHDSKGQKVGRCLMDAMLTIVDLGYSPKGGYLVDSNTPNDTMISSASWSCRPLDNIVAMMNHTDEEKSRCRMIELWLRKEHKFSERGYLPRIGTKLGQPVNITLLVRAVSTPAPKDDLPDFYAF
ncbi:C6 transcription factor [Talaromyces pinophilus]|uniref:C6 transcription factor n=1 Tax=Talaromyces pinophilus TaxID=128442 RepID=A0A6V8H422_TALPI|nr:C6 transcription factor [Talaromyces pinophilus]